MIGTRRRRHTALLLAAAAVALPALSACASTEDSVKTSDYISQTPGAWYRIANPVPTSNLPAVVPFPMSCKSPESRMGGPEGC